MDKNSQKTASNSGSKFVIVGIGNTILDFGLMNIFSIFIPAAFANFLSTGIAMISSFYFNKKWTFSSTARSRKDLIRQTIMFFLFTVVGIWLIQTPLMWLISNTFNHVFPHFSFVIFEHDFAKFLVDNSAKVVASVFSLTWNFLTYKRFVFKNNNVKTEKAEEISGL